MINQRKLTQKSFQQDLEQWLMDFVEKPNAALNGWAPCPYARKARVKNSVKFVYVEPQSFEASVEDQIKSFSDKFEVVVVGTLPANHSVSAIEDFSRRLRDGYWSQDFWILFDHPHRHEEVNGLKMNQGTYLLAMVQRLSKLAKASEHLDKDGYYQAWSESEKKQMTEERKEKIKRLARKKNQ